MSDQHEVGDSTSLEEVFNSQQFGVATRVAAPVLQGNVAVRLHNPPLEDVLHSARIGKPLTLLTPLRTGPPGAGALPAEEGAGTQFELRRRAHNRYRAIAAVSGVAAAALVVAGVTSGTVQPRPSSVSAQGPRSTARPQGGFGSSSGAASAGTPASSGPTPTATLTAAVGVAAGPSTFAAASPVGPGRRSGGQVNAGRPGGTNATAPPVPPAAPTGVAPTGPGGGSGAPPVPAPGGSPVAPVTTAVAGTVTEVGTSVTSVADQLGGSIPMTTPVTSAVRTVVSGIGQAVSSTTE